MPRIHLSIVLSLSNSQQGIENWKGGMIDTHYRSRIDFFRGLGGVKIPVFSFIGVRDNLAKEISNV